MTETADVRRTAAALEAARSAVAARAPGAAQRRADAMRRSAEAGQRIAKIAATQPPDVAEDILATDARLAAAAELPTT